MFTYFPLTVFPKMTSNDPCLLVFMLLCNPSPSNMSWTYWHLLIKWLWQKLTVSMLRLDYKKLWLASCSLSLAALMLEEVSFYVVCNLKDRPCEKALVFLAKFRENLRLPTYMRVSLEITLWGLPTSTWVNLGADSTSAELWDDCSLAHSLDGSFVRGPEPKDPANMNLDFYSSETVG